MLLKSKINSVFSYFVLSYIIILILPILVGGIVYHESINILKQQVIKSNLLMLEQTKEILDQRFMELENITMQLAFNDKIRQLLSISNLTEGSNIYKLRETSRNISSLELTNNTFITDIHIYIKNSNVILTPKTSYIRLPVSYGSIVCCKIKMDRVAK